LILFVVGRSIGISGRIKAVQAGCAGEKKTNWGGRLQGEEKKFYEFW
jgi:hypothetical protein